MGKFEDPTSLGNILLAMGLITSDQLKKTLQDQIDSTEEEMLGKFMLADGMIDQEALTEALAWQEELRNGKSKHDIAVKAAGLAHKSSEQVHTMYVSLRNGKEETD